MRNKIIVLLAFLLLLVFSQWLMVKLVYAHKLGTGPTKFFSKVYNLKMAVIEEESDDINIYLKDFFENKEFAYKLIKIQDDVKDEDVKDEEVSDLIWNKLLRKAWIDKLVEENNIEITDEDSSYYIDALGGQETIDKSIIDRGISMDEYNKFIINPDILEAKVYDYLISSFKDERGILKIEDAYSLLEAEDGNNWDEVAKQYSENSSFSENSVWLSEDELVDVYEPITEIEVGGFSKIIQIPIGYIIWRLDSISEEDEKTMREVRGIFVYSQKLDDFFNAYLETVNVDKKY